MGVRLMVFYGAFRCLVIHNTRGCLNFAENKEGILLFYLKNVFWYTIFLRVLPGGVMFYPITCLHFPGKSQQGGCWIYFRWYVKPQLLMKIFPDVSQRMGSLLVSRGWFYTLYLCWRKDLTCIDKQWLEPLCFPKGLLCLLVNQLKPGFVWGF